MLLVQKKFKVIHSSEPLAKEWMKYFLTNYTMDICRKMSLFRNTHIFRLFARIFSYRIHFNSRLQCVSVNVHNNEYEENLQYTATIGRCEQQIFDFSKETASQQSIEIRNKMITGQSCIVERNQFFINMDRICHYSKWKMHINWQLYNVAGGAIVNCITVAQYHCGEPQGVDLFLSSAGTPFDCLHDSVGENNDWRSLNNILAATFANDMRQKYDTYCFPHDENLNEGVSVYVRFTEKLRPKHSVPGGPIYPADECEFRTEIQGNSQFIHFRFIGPLHTTRAKCDHDMIINNFDIDMCQIRFDGSDVLATFAFIFAISSMTCISYDLQHSMQQPKPNWELFALSPYTHANWVNKQALKKYGNRWRQSEANFVRAMKYSNRGAQLLIPKDSNVTALLMSYRQLFSKNSSGCTCHCKYNTKDVCIPSYDYVYSDSEYNNSDYVYSLHASVEDIMKNSKCQMLQDVKDDYSVFDKWNQKVIPFAADSNVFDMLRMWMPYNLDPYKILDKKLQLMLIDLTPIPSVCTTDQHTMECIVSQTHFNHL